MALPQESESVSYPGARRPDRRRSVDSCGLRIAVYEWGDPDARPLLLHHGGFDFAGTYDGLAPLLADAGWRVVAFDQRGHGDSEHAALYSWPADLRDLKAVLDSIGHQPIAALGHSKGGSQLTDLIHALPHRIARFVNIDGLPSDHRHLDVAEHERAKQLDEVQGHHGGRGHDFVALGSEKIQKLLSNLNGSHQNPANYADSVVRQAIPYGEGAV